MKRILIILVAFSLVFLFGCDKTEDTVEEIKPIDFTGKNPGTIKILYPMSEASHPDAGFVQEWQTYMLDKHELDVDLIYTKEYISYHVDKAGAEETGADLEDLGKYADGGGFIYLCFNPENLTRIKDSGLVIPVNEHILKTPSLAVLDDKILNAFSDIEENIWAIPLGDTVSTSNGRFYNGDWLMKWGDAAPQTIDELYDFALFVRDDDPDGNGKNDTCLQIVNNSNFAYELFDVFQAFGCYFHGSYPIAYNPQKGNYENAVLTEGFSEAMEFLKVLKNEDMLMFSKTDISDLQDIPYKIASANAAFISVLGDCKNMVPGYYLKGTNKTDLIRIEVTSNCLMVLKGTKNVPEKIEYLLMKLKDNPDCKVDLQCGIKDTSYRELENYYSFHYIDENQGMIPKTGIFTSFDFGNAEKPIVTAISEDELNPVERVESLALWDFFKDSDIEALNSELAFSVSHLVLDNDIDYLNRKLLGEMRTLVESIMSGTATIEDAVTDFKTAAEKYYASEIIAEVNDRLN